jgi:hypothetical protein
MIAPTLRILLVAVLFAAVMVGIPLCTLADDGYAGGVGENPMPQNSKDIVMDSEVVNVILHKEFAEVECAYRFRNEGEAQTVIMGFPNQTRLEIDDGIRSPGIGMFRAFADGKELPVRLSTVNLKDGDPGIAKYGKKSGWFFHNVPFKKGETKVVVNKYIADHGATANWKAALHGFGYVLRTGASWKGVIGKADINVTFAGDVSWNNLVMGDEYYAEYGEKPPADYVTSQRIEPKNFKKNKNGLSWSFTNLEPDEKNDISITIYSSCNKPGPSTNRVSATSSLSAGQYKYPPVYACDGVLESAWAEGAKGSGIGETLKIAFNEKKILKLIPDTGEEVSKTIPATEKISEIRILPGYTKSRTLYSKYSRPKNVTLMLSDGTEKKLTLVDDPSLQYFKLDKPVNARWAKIRIDDVYPGSVGKDTYITEVEFGAERTLLPNPATDLLAKIPISKPVSASKNTQDTVINLGINSDGLSKNAAAGLKSKDNGPLPAAKSEGNVGTLSGSRMIKSIILVIIFGIIAVFALAVLAILYYRRKNSRSNDRVL